MAKDLAASVVGNERMTLADVKSQIRNIPSRETETSDLLSFRIAMR
jgi:hypothetical protein